MPAPEIQVLQLRLFDDATKDEKVPQFLQGMMNRMGVSYHKYGDFHENFPHRANGIDQLLQRLALYQSTGNTEWLIDMANYCMIEFCCPSHPDAHFRPTDSDESPGRVNNDGSVSHGRD